MPQKQCAPRYVIPTPFFPYLSLYAVSDNQQAEIVTRGPSEVEQEFEEQCQMFFWHEATNVQKQNAVVDAEVQES